MIRAMEGHYEFGGLPGVAHVEQGPVDDDVVAEPLFPNLGVQLHYYLVRDGLQGVEVGALGVGQDRLCGVRPRPTGGRGR